MPLLVLEDNIKILEFSGLLVKTNATKNCAYYLRYILIRYMCVYAVYCIFICHPMYIYKNHQQFSDVSETLTNIITAVMVTTNFLTIFLQNGMFYGLVDNLRRMSELHVSPTDENTLQIMKKTNKTCRLVTVNISLAALAIIGSLGFIALFDLYFSKDLSERCKCWYPTDSNAPFIFELLLAMFLMNVYPVIMSVIITVALFVCFFFHILGHLKMLKHKLRSLQARAEKIAKEKIRNLEEVKSNYGKHVETENPVDLDQILTNKTSECSQYINLKQDSLVNNAKVNEFSSTREASPRPGESEIESQRNKETRNKLNVQKCMENLLHECINHHTDILRFVQNFGKFWNPVFSAQVVVCLSSSVLMLASSAVKSMETSLIISLTAVLTFYVAFALCCFLSQQITDSMQDLKETIYDCDWLESSDSFKKSILIMLSMANQPIVIHAAKFVPMTHVTFMDVVKSAYSSYMVFSKF